MSVKTLLILSFILVSYTFGQNANMAVGDKKQLAANAARSLANSGGLPTPTPTPNNTIIRGKAFYEDDKSPVKRSIIMFLKKEGTTGEKATVTDENGEFELKNVGAGSYFPMVLASGAVNFFSNIDFSKVTQNERGGFADAVKGFQEFVADGKNNLEISVAVKRGGSISGKVTRLDGTPVIGGSIQILRKVDGKLQPVISDFPRLFAATEFSSSYFQIDDRGMYRFQGLPAGEYFIRVSEPVLHIKDMNRYPYGGPDYAMSFLFGNSTFLNTYFPNTINAQEAEPIKVELGKERTEMNIVIPDWKLFNVSGKIVSEKDGKPIKAKVYAIETDSLLFEPPSLVSERLRSYTQTDENGNWTFYKIPRGKYTIIVEPINVNYGSSAMSVANAAAAAANAAAAAANAAAAAANAAAAVVNANKVVKSGKSRTTKANTASNSLSNTNAKFEINPKPIYAKTSQNITVENSDVENVLIKAGDAAVITGFADFDIQVGLTGNVKIQIFNENDNLVGSKTLYVYDSSQYMGKIWKQRFEIGGLPKGKLKMKILVESDNIFLKSAVLNNLDLQQNSFEINAGQTLDNFKIAFGTKKKQD